MLALRERVAVARGRLSSVLLRLGQRKQGALTDRV